jgi:hypothetical protein
VSLALPRCHLMTTLNTFLALSGHWVRERPPKIACTLGRPFQHIALGGIRDDAEIRGHCRTYIVGGSGSLAQALRKAGLKAPSYYCEHLFRFWSSQV